MKGWKLLHSIAFFHIVIAISAATFLHLYFKQPLIVIGYHFIVVLVQLLSVAFIGYLLVQVYPSRFQTVKSSLFITCFIVVSWIMFNVYLAAFSGMFLVGKIIHFGIIKVYLKEIPVLMSSYPLYAWILTAIYLITSLSIVVCYWVWRTRLWQNVNQFVLEAFNMKIPVWAVFILLLVLSIGWRLYYTGSLLRIRHSNEPYVGVFHAGTQGKYLQHLGNAAESEGYNITPTAAKRNVVLIIVDCLRSDHMEVYGYPKKNTPFLSSLMADGKLHKVRHTYSTCSSSYCGIISTLASKSWHNIALNNFYLHDVLKKHGYRVNFILSGDHTNFYGLKNHYGGNIDLYIDGFDHNIKGIKSINDDELILRTLNDIDNYDGTPNFFYFHLMSNHAVSPLRKEYKQLVEQVDVGFEERMINFYDGRVLQSDAVIKSIFEKLDFKGYLKDALVIVTADHGDGLLEKGTVGHTQSLFYNELNIPLLIYDANEQSTMFENLESAVQLDIAPTILDRLGMNIPSSWEGRSLLNQLTTRYTYHQERKHLYGVIKHDSVSYKYLINQKSGEEMVFNLNNDSLDQHNIIDNLDSEIMNDLKKAFIEVYGKDE